MSSCSMTGNCLFSNFISNSRYITKLRVCFTPNAKLKKAMSLDNKAFTLERVDFATEEDSDEEEGGI